MRWTDSYCIFYIDLTVIVLYVDEGKLLCHLCDGLLVSLICWADEYCVLPDWRTVIVSYLNNIHFLTDVLSRQII